jgi:hypothetical protein
MRLTTFSMNGEHISYTPSERRGCLLRAWAVILMVGAAPALKHTGQTKAPFAGNCSTPSPQRLPLVGHGGEPY